MKALVGLLVLCSACSVFGAQERVATEEHAAGLAICQERARLAHGMCNKDAGEFACNQDAIDAYEACKKEKGL